MPLPPAGTAIEDKMKTDYRKLIKQIPKYAPPDKPRGWEPYEYKQQKIMVHIKKLMLIQPMERRKELWDDGDTGLVLQAKEQGNSTWMAYISD